ncbi:ATP-binding protein [Actinoallomurus purpureus]|uniref:ATP-binding protein n=1 Tax=Actinoallomurus purpureus TaxID=478114 RepID=UPI002092D3DE|nr:ATP-binding protein [Actinoallomurus purpureus]MCO6010310.1 ATP-binding protein [Actinoallomurus purpureus]
MHRSVLGAITLPGRPEEVTTARRFVAKTLAGHPQAETAVLLTSEAVTNSVVHTDSAMVTLVVLETHAGLRFEVTDEGGDTLPTVYDGYELREGRRGVFLIEELSTACGIRTHDAGLTFWFEL